MHKTISFSDVELLRESLIQLDRSRQHERNMRLETEGLLRGLRILTEVRDTQGVFDSLAGALRHMVPFEDAFLLSLEGRSGYRVIRSTSRHYLGLKWSPQGMLERVLKGETVAVFDTRQAPEWRDLPPATLEHVRSAVMVSIRSEVLRAAMVFVHSDTAFFSPAHVHLLKRFGPLIDQALSSISVRERLERECALAQAATEEKHKEIEVRRKAEAEIKRIGDLMRSAISYAPIYLWEVDEANRYTFAEGTQKVLGYTPEELLGQDGATYFDAADDPNRAHWLGTVTRQQPFENIVIRRRRKDGRYIWVSLSGSPVLDAEGRFCGFRGATMDVTESVEANLKLEDMALHDALTGLANRRKFLDRFDAAVARLARYGKPVSLLALDIDHFKRINDAYGHPAGDDVLVAIARVLEAGVRRTDLAARFGGEEFMVLLPDSDAAGAAEVAEKLRRTLADEPISVECGGVKETVKVTVSIGVATMSKYGQASFDDLSERADQALYAAKLSGRNRVCVEGRG
ncbi:MAG: sensor domain-containing diguanylate cyclase, partial [Rhodospirillaceae bacterium]|nr:sensor domain-containing diguanylate cyclase [Rhodospirillaceae bacterium]